MEPNGNNHVTAVQPSEAASVPREIVYSECYDLYRSWAIQSIDVLKGELLSLCFPLFTHW